MPGSRYKLPWARLLQDSLALFTIFAVLALAWIASPGPTEQEADYEQTQAP